MAIRDMWKILMESWCDMNVNGILMFSWNINGIRPFPDQKSNGITRVIRVDFDSFHLTSKRVIKTTNHILDRALSGFGGSASMTFPMFHDPSSHRWTFEATEVTASSSSGSPAAGLPEALQVLHLSSAKFGGNLRFFGAGLAREKETSWVSQKKNSQKLKITKNDTINNWSSSQST